MENFRHKAIDWCAKMAAIITEEIVLLDNIKHYLSFFEKINNKFKCLVTQCSKKYADKASATRHLKKQHPEIVTAIDGLKYTEKTDANIEIKAKTNPIKLMNAIIQLIVFHAIPFAFLNSKGFRYIMKYIDSFKQVGISFGIDRPNVQNKINETADRIKAKISSEVKGKLICLLLDIASRYNRSILGISIVYWHDGKPRTKTIGMETLKISQTGRNLYDLVKVKLSQFGISLQ